MMEKPDSDSGVAISLATSFVVTAVFYFIMNFLPDLIWEKEIEESQYSRRKIVHREVYGYVEEFIKLWESIVKTSDSDFRATSVGELFRSKSMVTAIQGLDLLSKSSIPLIVSDGLVFATWTDVIIDRLTKMERRGEIILDRYSNDIPEWVALSIYNLQNRYDGCQLRVIVSNLSKVNTKSFILSQCVPIVDEKMVDVDGLVSDVSIITAWINAEYDDLAKKHNSDGLRKCFG